MKYAYQVMITVDLSGWRASELSVAAAGSGQRIRHVTVVDLSLYQGH